MVVRWKTDAVVSLQMGQVVPERFSCPHRERQGDVHRRAMRQLQRVLAGEYRRIRGNSWVTLYGYFPITPVA